MSETLLVIFVLTIAIPFVVYMSVRLAAYGYLKGRRCAERDLQQEENEHGNSSST